MQEIVTTIVETADLDWPPGIRRAGRLFRVGLAGRLIVLIAGFVMIAEITIYIPAVANMRFNWLRAHLSAAYTASLALEDAPPGLLSASFVHEILASVGAQSIVLDRDGARRILASGDQFLRVDATYDLRNPTWTDLLSGAFASLTAPDGRVSTMISPAPVGATAIEVTMDEAPLKKAMAAFSKRLLIYSLIVSVMVATLAALAMHRMILRPVRRLTTSIVDFGADPADRSRIIVPSMRNHEIGHAERALAVMQEALAREISQKKNLANLGLAVAKINHDMRNMLSSAQILSDRLAGVTDPLAQRLAPKLVATLDRAIRFCQATLTYGRAVDEPARPAPIDLRAIVSEAAETVAPTGHGTVQIENDVPSGLQLNADPEQIFRVMLNLMRNGVEALERAGPSAGRLPVVTVRAWKNDIGTIVEVGDNGPGIPAMMRPTIFNAFQNSQRPGGTGLGLAIVADLIRAHSGTITLHHDQDDAGALFRITLPWLPAAR